MLLVRADAQSRTEECNQQRVAEDDGVIRVATEAGAASRLALARIAGLVACRACGCFFLACATVSLGGCLDVLAEEAGVDGGDMRSVDVD